MGLSLKDRMKRKIKRKEVPAPGEIRININACDGCGRCVMICPEDVFSLREISEQEIEEMPFLGRMKVKIKRKNKSFTAQPEKCTRCSLCENKCHEQAIRIGYN